MIDVQFVAGSAGCAVLADRLEDALAGAQGHHAHYFNYDAIYLWVRSRAYLDFINAYPGLLASVSDGIITITGTGRERHCLSAHEAVVNIAFDFSMLMKKYWTEPLTAKEAHSFLWEEGKGRREVLWCSELNSRLTQHWETPRDFGHPCRWYRKSAEGAEPAELFHGSTWNGIVIPEPGEWVIESDGFVSRDSGEKELLTFPTMTVRPTIRDRFRVTGLAYYVLWHLPV